MRTAGLAEVAFHGRGPRHPSGCVDAGCGRARSPLLSVYTASKAAVNAFTESLALELAPFDVRIRLVSPGRAPGTRFWRQRPPTHGSGSKRLLVFEVPQAKNEKYVKMCESTLEV